MNDNVIISVKDGITSNALQDFGMLKEFAEAYCLNWKTLNELQNLAKYNISEFRDFVEEKMNG